MFLTVRFEYLHGMPRNRRTADLFGYAVRLKLLLLTEWNRQRLRKGGTVEIVRSTDLLRQMLSGH